MDFTAGFRLLDHPFWIRSNLPGAEQALSRLLAPARAQIPTDAPAYELLEVVRKDDGPPYELFLEGRSIQQTRSPGSMLDWTIGDATRRAVDGLPSPFAMIHASAAVFGGDAVILPAPPDHGKTTTVAALVRAGWDLVTDEVVLLSTEDLLVHAFPRPLMISPSSMSVLPGLKERLPRSYELFRQFDFHVAPDDLRTGCLADPSPARFIVFPEYGDRNPTQLTPISRAEALVEILNCCFNLHSLGSRAPRVLGEILRHAACYRLSIGAIHPAVALIRRLFEGQVNERPTREPARSRS